MGLSRKRNALTRWSAENGRGEEGNPHSDGTVQKTQRIRPRVLSERNGDSARRTETAEDGVPSLLRDLRWWMGANTKRSVVFSEFVTEPNSSGR